MTCKKLELENMKITDVEPKQYYLMDNKGKIFSLNEFKTKSKPLKALIDNEVFKKRSEEKTPHIDLMRKLKLAEYDLLSQPGHLRLTPKGAFIFDLLADRSLQIALEQGATPVKTPMIYDLDTKAVSEHAKLFGQRMYKMKTGSRSFALRYAACFGQFSLLSESTLSHKDFPIKIFELADSYRLEQRGELLGLARVRKFHMPDMHILCRDLTESQVEFNKIYKRCLEEGERFGFRYASLYNVAKNYLEDGDGLKHVKSLVRMEKEPILLYVVEPKKYYWFINVEFNFVSDKGRIIESATAQIDVGNAERFNIRYFDEKGNKRTPVIIHTAVIGSLERFMADMLEKASVMKKPSLPTWISPVQIRLINITASEFEYCENLVRELNQKQIRSDLDDRKESLGKKIASAEVEWIPFIVVVGNREVKNKKLSVRIRTSQKTMDMTKDELVSVIKNENKEWPYRPLYFNSFVSKRPSFV
jgi:threonyl-tRNA synthetase